MIITFEYKETPYLHVNNISVIGSFNEYNPNLGRMKRIDDKWIWTTSIPTGEYKYKFFINNCIKLNDVSANMYSPDDNGELWSCLIINKDDLRLYNNTSYSVNIDDYALSSQIYDGDIKVNKKDFNLALDKKVVSRFTFTNITGIHSVTVLWFDAAKNFFDYSENILFSSEEILDKPIVLWFWIDLQKRDVIYSEGIWTMKLFIDGEFALEDIFHIGKAARYSPTGNIYFVHPN